MPGLSDKTLGVGASLLSPLFMVLGFYVWDSQWKGGAFLLNLFKCSVAGTLFAIVSLVSLQVCPTRAVDSLQTKVLFLLLSSLLGIIIGDNCWLRGLILLGPRRIIAIDSLKPGLAGLFGSFVLDEDMSAEKWVGLCLSSIGVYLVCSATAVDKAPGDESESEATGSKANCQPPQQASDVHDASTASEEPVAGMTEDVELVGDADSRCAAQIVDSPTAVASHSPDPVLLVFSAPVPVYVALKGYGFAAINVLLDVVGSVLTKKYGKDFTTFEINAIRFAFAAAIMGMIWFAALLWVSHAGVPPSELSRTTKSEAESSDCEGNQNPELDENVKLEEVGNFIALFPVPASAAHVETSAAPHPSVWYLMPSQTRRQWLLVVFGVLLVTFTSPALGNYALFKISLGMSLTLSSVGPLYSIPLDHYVKGQAIGRKALVGAVLAVAGVAILSLL
jgi:drug/metabolite transporter (DMT)-like permease